MSRFTYGYRIDLENFDELERKSARLPLISRRDRDAFPKKLDPRGWCRIENQGSMGSCQGHAQSSVCEQGFWIATKGDVLQFSPKFAYIMSQRVDRITGDQGSTINGGRISAMQNGSCPLDVCPYDERYNTNIPAAAIEAAKPFKIRSHTLCRNYDDVFDFLASGQGGVEIGIAWPDAWMECDGVLESFRPGGGGHALALMGYDDEHVDRQGRNYLWMANSWSPEWGDRGWALVSPDCCNQFAKHPDTVMIGLSDLSVPEVRSFDWTGGM